MSDTAFSVQVTVDCERPHHLADWWAETMRWRVEPQDESFIRSMIEQGFATDDDTTTHDGKLVWAEATAIGPAEADGPGQPRMLFMKVPEAKSVKNRVHFDLRTGIDDPTELDALRQELVERGASIVGEGRQGPHTWKVMTDPEGNEFCV